MPGKAGLGQPSKAIRNFCPTAGASAAIHAWLAGTPTAGDCHTHEMTDEEYAHMMALINRNRRRTRGSTPSSDNPNDPIDE